MLAQQIPNATDAQQLGNLLKYGQMGLALAILVVGAGLFAAGLKQQNLSDTTARVLKLFATVMVILFVVSFLGEMTTKILDLWDKHRPVLAMIELPPLNERNYKDYGPIEIMVTDMLAVSQPAALPANRPQTFPIHNGAVFRIDLGSLTSQVGRSQNIAATAVVEATGKPNAIGTGTAQ